MINISNKVYVTLFVTHLVIHVLFDTPASQPGKQDTHKHCGATGDGKRRITHSKKLQQRISMKTIQLTIPRGDPLPICTCTGTSAHQYE